MKTDLSPAKRALLEKWLQGKQASTNNEQGISRRTEGSEIKLSFSQQRQLFLELLDRGTAVNNLSVFIEFKGNFDLTALTESANQILSRHEILRTSFLFDMGIPSANISQDLSIEINVVDLQEFEGDDVEAEARKLAEKEVLNPFNLSQAPLIQIKLYKLNEEKYFLLFVAHHTVADGWSLGVFLKELMANYEANTIGRSNQESELPIQYFDYANWQSDESKHKTLQSSLSYWKEQLGGDLPVLELPTDRQRGARQTFTGGTHRFQLSRSLTEGLEKLSREENVTLYMTLLTAFNIVLHKYSEQDEILIGTPVANRSIPELESLIGVFINVIVLRTSMAGDLDFRSLLQEVKKVATNGYSYQDLPFEKLVEELKPKRDLSRSPLFQVLFNLQNAPMPELKIQGIETAFLDIDRGVSQFDITLMISKIAGEYHATVEYNSDLFEPSTIDRIFKSYQLILEAALTQPDSPISKLKFAPQDEIDNLVHGLNQTQFDFPREKCMHQLFEEQVEKTPDAVALIYNETSLSYRELNKRANVRARHLQELGVGPKVRIAILMERSLELLETLLSIQKSGGVYVPIHSTTPTERIQYILKDADVQVLCTNIDLGTLDDSEVHIIKVNEEQLLSNSDSSNLKTQITSDDLAYIIYTSGSTGTPKGVMVNHFALVNFLWTMRLKPGIKSEDVLLAVTFISFDIAALEIFLPVISGATVIMASEEMVTNPELIGEAIDRHQVSIMQATPSTWRLLVNSGWPGKQDLKALCGGDVLSRKLADSLLSRVGNLWNMYGPTETTIWSSICEIQNDDSPITIGQPIGNTQLYILNRNEQPTPIGVVGELHIGGSGLAMGYLNQPELTNEKFIPDSIGSLPNARLYKTGDSARFLADNSIEILGRMDNQLKLNGYRLELGEISSLLIQHPSVNNAVVIARIETYGDKRLIAYFVANENSSVEANELRDFLKKKLPPYMLPAFFIALDSIPVTPNGKINRKALPLPEDTRKLSGYLAPRNETEEILVEVWQNVLNIEQVGVNDNFFDLGGASIQSIQVVAKANMYGYQVSVENIFELQTIAELASHIGESTVEDSSNV